MIIPPPPRVNPPPPALPTSHPWAAAVQAWADQVNLLQPLSDEPVFVAVDDSGVHLAYWPDPRCPHCDGGTPADHPWTIPPDDVGGVTWRWLHSCGHHWYPRVGRQRWDILEVAVPAWAEPIDTQAALLAHLTRWLLDARAAMTGPDDDDFDGHFDDDHL